MKVKVFNALCLLIKVGIPIEAVVEPVQIESLMRKWKLFQLKEENSISLREPRSCSEVLLIGQTDGHE